MTVLLIVFNLLLNIQQQIHTTDANKQQYYNSSEFVVVDELNM